MPLSTASKELRACAITQNLIEFVQQERPETCLERRTLGSIEMIEVDQEAGSFPDPATNSYSLQLIRAGGGGAAEISYGGHQFCSRRMSVGNIVLAPYNTYCEYHSESPVQIMVLLVPFGLMRSVGAELNPHFTGDLSMLHDGFFHAPALVQHMLRIWRAAVGEQHAPVVDPEAETMLLAERLIRLSFDQRALKHQPLHLSTHARLNVLQYIEQHLTQDVSLSTLAKTANLSNFYFLRAFKAEMGMTPRQYVIDQRIQRAKHYLKKSSNDIAEVALQSGFSSHQHLTTVFSKAVGRTPSVFRKAVSYSIF
jgi:AraC family transcriptional regulator